MQTSFDIIVIGLGGMGSATCFELARRGHRVLGLEQFRTVHSLGSSHGQTRIIRKAYYEHPAYVPLVERAYQRWYELEQLSGRHLLTECACLSLGTPESELIQGVQRAATEHDLKIESLDTKELRRRFSPFHLSEEYVGLLEQEAGFLMVEECVRAYLNLAREQAQIREEEAVTHWRAISDGVEVTTTKNTYRAAKLVLTAGPWAAQLLGELGSSLRVMRQVLLWFGTKKPEAFRRDRFPIFIADVPEGKFYGLPMIDSQGVKIAEHYGAPELLSPDQIHREILPEDEARLRRFLKQYLPEVDGPLQHAQTCIYTLSPDRHFIIDGHPQFPQVTFATGFSGHGFKFASVVGEILADLCETGTTKWGIEMFRIRG